MKRCLAVLLLAFGCASTNAAQYVIQHNGMTQFQVNGTLTPPTDGVTYNFVDAATPPPPTGACVVDPLRPNRLTTGIVGYSVRNQTNPYAADFTAARTIYGRATATDMLPGLDWPWISGSGPNIRNLGRGAYYAAHFVTPISGHFTASLAAQSNNARGCKNTNGTAGRCGQPYFDYSISTRCNDFNPTTAYVILNIPSDGTAHFRFNMGYGLPIAQGGLQPTTGYYLNVRYSESTDYWTDDYQIMYNSLVGGKTASVLSAKDASTPSGTHIPDCPTTGCKPAISATQ